MKDHNVARRKPSTGEYVSQADLSKFSPSPQDGRRERQYGGGGFLAVLQSCRGHVAWVRSEVDREDAGLAAGRCACRQMIGEKKEKRNKKV